MGGGYPLETGTEKGSTYYGGTDVKWSHFGAKVSTGTPPKKHSFLGSSPKRPKRAQERHRSAQDAQKVAKRHHFGDILGHFSEHRGQSENRAPARTGAQFWRFRGTPKASIFERFSKTIPSTSQEGTLEGPCEDFFRFLRILGGFWAPHWPPIFSIFEPK